MTYPDDPKLTDRPPSQYDYSPWVAAAVGLLVLAAVGVWAYSGPTKNSITAAPTGLTGQASSATGSTSVGAPPGTKPSQTTGQATSSSGSATTGAAKP
jgi:hypothetical protein